MYACVREFSGGCVITVTGSNFNVSSTAQLKFTNDQLDIQATAAPVCRILTNYILIHYFGRRLLLTSFLLFAV